MLRFIITIRTEFLCCMNLSSNLYSRKVLVNLFVPYTLGKLPFGKNFSIFSNFFLGFLEFHNAFYRGILMPR